MAVLLAPVVEVGSPVAVVLVVNVVGAGAASPMHNPLYHDVMVAKSPSGHCGAQILLFEVDLRDTKKADWQKQDWYVAGLVTSAAGGTQAL